MNVYNYADILVEGAFRAIECRLAQMKVFSHYCLTFSANDGAFSLNEQQKVYLRSELIEYAMQRNIRYTKGHKTRETNYAKLTSNTKLKARINPNSSAYMIIKCIVKMYNRPKLVIHYSLPVCLFLVKRL